MRRILVSFAVIALLCAAPTFANASGDKDAPKTAKAGAESSATAPNKVTEKAQPAKPEDVAPATELQKLQDLIQAQQQALAEQRKALDEQQKEINALQGRSRDESTSPIPVASTTDTNSASAPVTRVAETSSTEKETVAAGNESSSLSTKTTPAGYAAATPNAKATAQSDQSDQSPLFFKIGGAEFTPLGFLDFTGVYRSTDVGSGIGTSFGSIPFNGASPAGQLSELRFSAQNSRVGIKVDANPGDFKVRGYLEADFLGNAAANLQIGSHSNTMRMRLYWVDVRRGKWEVLAGQSWSMMTPNRVGISPMPGDIFYSQDMDTNYQNGLVWLRTPGVRLVYHANDNITWGFALEDPEQYTGGLVTFPAGFNTSQVDDAGGNSKTPNKAPDIESKLAFDTHPNGGGRNLHVEIAGIYRAFRLNTTGLGNVTKSGGGGSINANLELFKNFRLIANTFWSDGGGRYIFQLGPDFTVNVNGAGNFVPSPLHAGSGIGGFEYTINKSLLYAYYGGVYFGRDFVATTGTGGTTYTGYGYPGSNSSQNRTIQEGTIGVNQTLWSDKKYGDLKLLTQISYLSRNPWSTTGTPGNAASAHLGMAFVDLRYDLP